MAKIKRSEVQTFLNTTPLSTATYSLIGDGVPSGEITMNPATESVTFIHENNATVTVEGYAPTIAVEQIAKNGDAVFEFIDNLRRTRAILEAAETDIVNVWMYETGGPTAYPAEKQSVVIAIDKFGGDGGKATKIGYTIHYRGNPTVGTFNASTKAFTAS